ncbi:hypothetical protein EDD18DRAFT_1360920 [Armillaria luteobubalina]|uniref:Uncharacterized protein n=1 Tax=Armillaria luteobubalina TaxID=153913 RepID=A0AA39PKX5_9AGAR|nr:hypothetical protein EDD18DRAFT_1360920 [Armillaria luteobubalina]
MAAATIALTGTCSGKRARRDTTDLPTPLPVVVDENEGPCFVEERVVNTLRGDTLTRGPDSDAFSSFGKRVVIKDWHDTAVLQFP